MGLARTVIALAPRRPRVLLYHACEPTETPFIRGLGSNSPPDRFALQMAYLVRYYTPVDLNTCLSPERPQRAVAITFDDGYRSVYEHAFPILRAHDLMATVYVIADAEESMVWVNSVNWILNSHLTDTVREMAAARMGVDATAINGFDLFVERLDPGAARALASDMAGASGIDLLELARKSELFLSRQQMAEMARNGIAFGNHTSTHPNLSRASAVEARAEVEGAHRRLSRLPGFIPSFAYPFGRLSSDAKDEARRLGYTTIMQVGGINEPLDRLAVARQPVAGDFPAELFANMEVVEPIKAWIRKSGQRARSRRGDP